MQGRSWGQAGVLVAGVCVVLWVVGLVLFLLDESDISRRFGFVLILIAALTTNLGLMRSWQLRMHRAFVHGYHSGWHNATQRQCSTKSCDVLEFSEIRARHLSRLG